MTPRARRFHLALALATVCSLPPAAARTPPPAQRPQVFRTGVDLVMVDVSVRDGGRAVTGLNVTDFTLTDNGVRQQIESVEATSVPIDLTLVVDLSGSPRGPATAAVPFSKVGAELEAEVGGITKVLRPTDRLRLLAVDRHVQELLPMQPVSSLAGVEAAEFDGPAALYDTLAAALLYRVEPSRRHVVIARTKGADTMSSIDAQAVAAIAERSDAAFHVTLMESAFDFDSALSGFQCQMYGLCWPSRRFWVPFERRMFGGGLKHPLLRDGQVVAAAAEATGGALHKTAGLSVPTLVSTFKKAFDDFRTSYVLRYTPAAVARPGWHAIEVKVRGPRSYRVRARSGYLVEAPIPEREPPAVIPDAPRTLPELIAAYEAGGYGQVVAALRQASDPSRLIRDFSEGANPWPAAPRREAAFALELAEPALFSGNAATREAAYDLLARFSRLVRHPLEPDEFERAWYLAALTLLEGSIRPAATETFCARALERFPDEPRFVLSQAIAADQRLAASRGMPAVTSDKAKTADHEAGVQRLYEASIGFPSTAVEARLRLAWLLHRRGDDKQALTHLAQSGSGPITDRALAYLRHLFLGHVLWALDRRDEAVAAHRAALAVLPSAQSARVALMNALLVMGGRAEAEAIAEHVQVEAGGDIDPWWTYWQGQYRLQAQAMSRLREMSQ